MSDSLSDSLCASTPELVHSTPAVLPAAGQDSMFPTLSTHASIAAVSSQETRALRQLKDAADFMAVYPGVTALMDNLVTEAETQLRANGFEWMVSPQKARLMDQGADRTTKAWLFMRDPTSQLPVMIDLTFTAKLDLTCAGETFMSLRAYATPVDPDRQDLLCSRLMFWTSPFEQWPDKDVRGALRRRVKEQLVDFTAATLTERVHDFVQELNEALSQ